MSDPPTETAKANDPIWSGRKVVVALTGGIAGYKTATLVSRLVQAGAQVRVMMTDAATRFVTPLTFQSLSGQMVQTSIWQSDDHPDSQHVGLARWCDLMVIAPATADIMAKLAAGFCDNVVALVATALPDATPLLIAPAMNADMWASTIVQRNLNTLKNLLRCHIVGPAEGWQACRTVGPGRMSDPEDILKAAAALLKH